MFNGLIWQLVSVKGALYVHRFDDPNSKKAEKDVAGSWPNNAFCVVHADRGVKDALLTDCLWNPEGRLFISARLKGCLVRVGVTDVEFLPLKIIDRTGRLIDPDYSLIHFRNAPDCLDLEASGATRSRAIRSKAETLERLVFKSDPGRLLFRPLTYSKVTLVSLALAETMANEGFSGMRFMGLFDFGIRGDLPPNSQRFAVDTLCNRLWTNAQKQIPS
jgi:hypothetical protein